MSQPLQNLPGFRDFFPESCAERNYVFAQWRAVARDYGFVEYEVPVLEPTELYTRKSGEEIVGQLFHFVDRGDRAVALRPEITPSLARMAAARQRDYKKPLKWFQIGSCFRFEKPQRGRGREFYQFNCDILGESGIGADAELVALAVDLMIRLGFQREDFLVRLSDRRVWNDFAHRQGVSEENLPAFLQVIDKLERDKPEEIERKLAALGTSSAAVREMIANPAAAIDGTALGELLENLAARGLAEFVEVDLGIVRGLAYYTGVVFEIFDRKGELRAVAGGGRYNDLCKLIGGVDIPAAGFAMGDMVIDEFIRATGRAKAKRDAWLAKEHRWDLAVIIADEAKRHDALGLVQRCRAAGIRTDYPLAPAKVGKQFQAAEFWNARLAVVVGAEFPQVSLKNMLSREESAIGSEDVVAEVQRILANPPHGVLLAENS